MNKLSVKSKIAIWTSLFVMITALLSSFAVIYFSNHVVQNTIKRNLISGVEDNINEIKIYTDKQDVHLEDEFDILVESNGLYIEVDDDFTKYFNDITTTLYDSKSVLYGESVVSTDAVELEESGVRTVKNDGVRYYVYDKKVNSNASDSLWLRGTVLQQVGMTQTIDVIDSYLFIIPLMVFLAVAGAFVIAHRTLKPIDEISTSADDIRLGNDLTKRLEIEGKGKELDTLIASFNGMLERLESSFERERRFSSDISHELRTPISVILSASELAFEENDEKQYIESLELIERQGKKMRTMINSMLEYSRLGTDGLQFGRIGFSGIVNTSCNDMRLIEKNNITLISEIENGVYINGDYELITRLCENLISNAYKYGRDNGTIRVSLKSINDFAELSVKDDGIGINSGETEKIFNAFYQASKSRTQTGFGLGLSFVKKIAELHGGEITVISTEGVGSEFIYKQKLYN